jgi:hypothetical protein
VGIYPTPAPPRKGAIDGPTQPIYWANSNSNLDFVPKNQDDRPSYNGAWGWTDGAQDSSFAGGDPSETVTPVETPGNGGGEGVKGETTGTANVPASRWEALNRWSRNLLSQ